MIPKGNGAIVSGVIITTVMVLMRVNPELFWSEVPEALYTSFGDLILLIGTVIGILLVIPSLPFFKKKSKDDDSSKEARQ